MSTTIIDFPTQDDNFNCSVSDSISAEQIFGMDESFPTMEFPDNTMCTYKCTTNTSGNAKHHPLSEKDLEVGPDNRKQDYSGIEMTDDETCDSNNDTASVASSVKCMPPPRKKTKIIPMKKEKLELHCEWEECDFYTESADDFVTHVSYHIPDLEVREDLESKEVYGCLWRLCDFETADAEEVKRHVNFHSYHTKIKHIGKNLLERTPDVTVCALKDSSKNVVPDFPEPFICNWNSCSRVFTNSQIFYYHVREHVECNQRGKYVEGGVQCLWTNCKANFRSLYRLSEHTRTHTQEKYIACPNCGSLFASSTKLVDHCKRQTGIAITGQSFQCSHCSKYFPSERLLRDHMRHHVNHYKCTFCDMTCPTPSALSLHIRYKHLSDKPFRCQFCGFRAKTKADLTVHTSTHSRDMQYKCEEKGCDYSCRSSYGLDKHFRKVHGHGDDEPLYCCHLCDNRFYRGAHLTRHLFKTHNFRWPNGHCRFRYKNEQGLYHLQTVRYESLEVTEEMMRAENSNTGQLVAQRSEAKPRSVHITIAQLDDGGNVVSANEIEADELSVLPEGATAITCGSSYRTGITCNNLFENVCLDKK